MVKFDPNGFRAMMARIEAERLEEEQRVEEERRTAALGLLYEELEPDYEYMPLQWRPTSPLRSSRKGPRPIHQCWEPLRPPKARSGP